MSKDLETLLFIKELGRLLEDYNRCPDRKIKALIKEEISLLTKVIHPS